ncbi:MAG: hypothetical protein L6R38_004637 [Xanthoria sp. 2 TBL-2021]|nr:MAG: hypothetical protein L6R38_004637 [Xanthoria sp. 2 TBL-2021]
MKATTSSGVDIDEHVLAGKTSVREKAMTIITDRSLANVIPGAELPEGARILSIVPSGASVWVQTVRIDVQLNDGNRKTYFKKGAFGARGHEMMRGAFESEKTLHFFAPNNVPKPLAWGTYKNEPDKHFYMCDFYDMTDDLPDIQKFCAVVARIHLDSMGKSPDNRYGFSVTTHLAYVGNDNSWSDSWEEWYAKALKRMLEEEEKSHGPDEELAILTKAMFEKVVPRLLRPLETGGRQIQPCLIHSDLWPGNVKPDAVTDEPIIFDACAFWGHNEADLGPWRAPRYRLGRSYMKEYHNHIPISVPVEDWDDRNALYAMRYDLLVSALFPEEPKFRRLAMDEMKRLVDKYPGGYEAFKTQEVTANDIA